MTDEEFRKALLELEAAGTAGSAEALEKTGDLLVGRAEELSESDPEKSASLLSEADEKYQDALSIDDSAVPLYEKLSRLYLRMAADADPDDAERLTLEAAIFDLGAGSALVMQGDLAAARDRFFRGFEATKASSKISIIPFTFILGIDFAFDRTEEKYYIAAKKLQPTANLSGHEEVDIICKAIVDKKITKALKPTLTARAASRLASMMLA
jgi:hypothetical protein